MTPIVIAQVSDLHFGREIPRIADALCADLHALRPSLVAVCGDLTQSARGPEFAAARRYVDALPTPQLVVPGNHDLPGLRVWSRVVSPWRRWTQAFGDPHRVQSMRGDGFVAVGVNTARQWHAALDWSRGRINPMQLDAITHAFDAAPEPALRVLLAHHPFALVEAHAGRRTVGRAALALRTLARARTDLVLGGHVHVGYSAIAGGMVVAQSGTAFSSRLKGEPNGYNVIRAGAAALTVDAMRWDGAAFAVFATTRYVRDGAGWRA